jgi:hypothetical protein
MQERDEGTMKEDRRERLFHHRDTKNTENGHKAQHFLLLHFKGSERIKMEAL